MNPAAKPSQADILVGPAISASGGHASLLDRQTARAASMFLEKISTRFGPVEAILFGSRARGTFHSESDADIAVIVKGPHGTRSGVAMDMAGIAFDIMLETGILVDPLPLWEDEIRHPELFGNPALIGSILREGVRL